MAGRGPTPKPDRPGSRVVTRPKVPELALVGEFEPPPPPAGLLAASKAWWEAFWASDLAKAVQADTDIQALERLVLLRDDRDRAYRQLRKDGPVSAGSQGQPVMHPLVKYVAQLDAELRQLEDRFGLNPRARLSLGLRLTQARRELEDLWHDEDTQPTPLEVIDLAGGDVPGSGGPVRGSRDGGS